MKKPVFYTISGFIIPAILYFITSYFNKTDNGALRLMLFYHWFVFGAVMLSLYVTARRNKFKILFVYLIAGGLKIIFSGLFFAFVLAWAEVKNFKAVTFFFATAYIALLLVETGYARALVRKTCQNPKPTENEIEGKGK